MLPVGRFHCYFGGGGVGLGFGFEIEIEIERMDDGKEYMGAN